ncbi:hypothetical protein KIN20_016087 [Parelaphostrongylus tenuis]|uniref:Uncharacterized protein n=1 Tax=Parelaphostrongylus tenuis TaxID=148309 RepID=A0AAD5QSX3_PARTN|nr:hypothetical protein KIN20_015864 [Parelaphostrongylus tenuis]KAJ1357836.1 hypothetical protein KIN20_016087 [Parelaphostrongylus tenuis]
MKLFLTFVLLAIVCLMSPSDATLGFKRPNQPLPCGGPEAAIRTPINPKDKGCGLGTGQPRGKRGIGK